MGRAGADPLAGQEWWLPHVGADRAAPPGPGVPLTIVDSGVDPAHPEFAGRPGTTFLNPQTVTGRDEYHGTAVASIAAAPENGTGLVGLYPAALLQIFDASPISSILDHTAIQGIAAASEHCPGVINLSFGSTRRNPDMEQAILNAVHQGCLVVAASGNSGLEGSPATYPAAYPHVLTVGASDERDGVAPFSTVSATLDLVAPGVDMAAAVPQSRVPSGYAGGFQGTSFASPIVAAAAAWVWTVRPTLDATQVAEVLRASARDVGAPGFDPAAGFGLLDVPAALAAPTPSRDPLEPNDDVDQVSAGRLFALGDPLLTSPAKPTNRIAGRLLADDDPRDVYRIWVPANRVVRATVTGDATARIWGPQTETVAEEGAPRRRDLRGTLVRGGKKGFAAYVEVQPAGGSRAASYLLSVRAARR